MLTKHKTFPFLIAETESLSENVPKIHIFTNSLDNKKKAAIKTWLKWPSAVKGEGLSECGDVAERLPRERRRAKRSASVGEQKEVQA